MKICPKCMFENDDSDVFCRRCRTRVNPLGTCPRGHVIDPTWPDCPYCKVSASMPPLLPGSAVIQDVRSRRKARVTLGDAPDGLPWVLHIDRGSSAAELLAPIASRLGYQSADEYQNTPFQDVASRLNDLFNQRDLIEVDTGEARVECYVTGRPVGSIVGATLLSRLLHKSGITIPNAARHDTRSAFPAASPITVAAEANPPVRADIGTGHLALPLDGGQPLIVNRIQDPGVAVNYRFVRRFELESLAAFSSAKFECSIPETGDRFEGAMNDAPAYKNVRSDAFRSRQRYDLICRIDRSELAARMVDVANELDQLHKSGVVHGDLKPANILVTAAGVRLIDSLDLQPGRRSPAMTFGWAAPEQVIGGNVEFATDQYALGVLLSTLLGGVMYGEESSFVVPVGGPKVERFTLLRNPGVYIPHAKSTMDEESQMLWQQLLNRCLRFEARERFTTMADLAAELKNVSASAPLEGHLEMDPSFGSLAGDDLLYWPLWDSKV